MFDGLMPPRADAEKTAALKVFSGRQTFPTVTPPALPGGAELGVVSGAWPDARPRVLQLGVSTGNPTPGAAFPPVGVFTAGGMFVSSPAGIVDSAGAPVKLAFQPFLACVIEYGAGGANQKQWIDWYQGAYNLPPCDYVRVSALPWGDYGPFTLNAQVAVASLSTGEMQGAHVPTVTAVGPFLAGVARSFPTPTNARGIEVTCTDPTVATTVTISGAASGTRNLLTGVLVPGWTPLELDLGVAAVSVTSSAAANLRVQWFLEL